MNIPIVFSTDNNYIMPTGVAILSLLESAKPTTLYDIFVLVNDDVTEESKNLLCKQVACFPKHTIDFISVGKVFEGAFEIRNISIAAYSRLLIPWLLPQYDKVIYSDVDVIFRIDLSDVFNIELDDNYFAGIPAITFLTTKSYEKYLLRLGLVPGEYINSGFLIINSKLQREDNLKDGLLREAKNNYIYQDQDVINLVCKDKITHISPAYCITSAFYQMLYSNNPNFKHYYENPSLIPASQNISESIENYKRGENCILHYAGKKPWNTFTQSWRKWWDIYQHSVFYVPDQEIEISRSILCPKPSWRSIASQIKRKLITIGNKHKF